MPNLNTLIPILFLAVTFAALYTYYHTRILGDFIRTLDKENATDENTALSPKSVCGNKVKGTVLAFLLPKSTVLRRFVAETEVDGEKKYYLVAENRENTLSRYNAKGMSFMTVIVCVLIMAAFSFVAYIIAPYMETVLNDYSGNNYVPDDEINIEFSESNGNTQPENSGGGTQKEENNTGNRYENRFETAE